MRSSIAGAVGALVLSCFVSCANFSGLTGGEAIVDVDGGGGGGGGGDDGSVQRNDSPSFVEGGPPEQCATNPHCSADLHSVLDCHDNVLATCPADQGCSAGGCIAACDAAKANGSTVGCEYYDPIPNTDFRDRVPCFALFIANTWSEPVTIDAAYDGQPLPVSTIAVIPSGTGTHMKYETLPGGQLPAGQVAILFLANTEGTGTPYGCPTGTTAALTTQPGAGPTGTGLYPTFHISTSRPVTAYDMLPYGGGRSQLTSATLLLPTSVWDKNYVALGPGPGTPMTSAAGTPYVAIVAAEDDTTVSIVPKTDIAQASGLGGAGNQLETFKLQKGQSAYLTTTDPLTEIAGSPIQADKPIGVFGGVGVIGIPANAWPQDGTHQQIPPVSALGSEYASVRYRNRIDTGPDESPPWRLVGAVDGTVLTYEPSAPTGAPTTLSSGQVVTFNASNPFVVRSQDAQHPFHSSAYMTGCNVVFDEFVDCRGDPEWVNVVPTAQYLQNYVFFTDPTYPETNLVIVRRIGPGGFADVKLDCAGTLGGWQTLGSSGELEYTRIDLSRHDFQPQNGCDNGRHEISSANQFGVTVWGWGSAETGANDPGNLGYSQAVSYAYPIGESGKPINTVIVPAKPK